MGSPHARLTPAPALHRHPLVLSNIDNSNTNTHLAYSCKFATTTADVIPALYTSVCRKPPNDAAM